MRAFIFIFTFISFTLIGVNGRAQEKQTDTLNISTSFCPTCHDKEFKPVLDFAVSDYSMKIYDRWGELIFESKDSLHGWDGKFKGKEMQEDIYIWKIKFTRKNRNKPESYTGHLTMVR